MCRTSGPRTPSNTPDANAWSCVCWKHTCLHSSSIVSVRHKFDPHVSLLLFLAGSWRQECETSVPRLQLSVNHQSQTFHLHHANETGRRMESGLPTNTRTLLPYFPPIWVCLVDFISEWPQSHRAWSCVIVLVGNVTSFSRFHGTEQNSSHNSPIYNECQTQTVYILACHENGLIKTIQMIPHNL